jgi:hypothetical protein
VGVLEQERQQQVLEWEREQQVQVRILVVQDYSLGLQSLLHKRHFHHSIV